MSQKQFLPVFLTILIVFLGFTSCDSTKNVASQDQGKAIHLFNGKNLDGWYTYLRGLGKNKDPKNVFTVNDGMIHITGEDWGVLTTDEEYENYHLITEFKWGNDTHGPKIDKARDNGILLHSTGKDGARGGSWMYSIECQLIEGGTGDFLVVGDGSDRFAITSPVAEEKQENAYLYEPGGEKVTIHSGRINWWGRSPEWKNVLGFRGKDDVEKPVGEWNRMECIASGDTLTVILNDVVVNKTYNVKPSKGKIQIQSEGAEIYFRRVDLILLNNKSN